MYKLSVVITHIINYWSYLVVPGGGGGGSPMLYISCNLLLREKDQKLVFVHQYFASTLLGLYMKHANLQTPCWYLPLQLFKFKVVHNQRKVMGYVEEVWLSVGVWMDGRTGKIEC